MNSILNMLGGLNAFAIGLGLDGDTVRLIAGEVEAEANCTPGEVSIDDRLREVRRRLIEAASAPDHDEP